MGGKLTLNGVDFVFVLLLSKRQDDNLKWKIVMRYVNNQIKKCWTLIMSMNKKKQRTKKFPCNWAGVEERKKIRKFFPLQFDYWASMTCEKACSISTFARKVFTLSPSSPSLIPESQSLYYFKKFQLPLRELTNHIFHKFSITSLLGRKFSIIRYNFYEFNKFSLLFEPTTDITYKRESSTKAPCTGIPYISWMRNEKTLLSVIFSFFQIQQPHTHTGSCFSQFECEMIEIMRHLWHF